MNGNVRQASVKSVHSNIQTRVRTGAYQLAQADSFGRLVNETFIPGHVGGSSGCMNAIVLVLVPDIHMCMPSCSRVAYEAHGVLLASTSVNKLAYGCYIVSQMIFVWANFKAAGEQR